MIYNISVRLEDEDGPSSGLGALAVLPSSGDRVMIGDQWFNVVSRDWNPAAVSSAASATPPAWPYIPVTLVVKLDRQTAGLL